MWLPLLLVVLIDGCSITATDLPHKRIQAVTPCPALHPLFT